MVNRVLRRFCKARGDSLIESRTCTQVEIAKDRRSGAGIRIPLVVEAEAKCERQIAAGFPRVLGENSPGLGSGIPIPKLLLAGDGVIHDTPLRSRGILSQLQ